MNKPDTSSNRLGLRIGRAVREARTRRKMKLTDLAHEVGRTAAQISTLERGIYQWTDSVLEACAKALDLPLATLFAEEDQLVLTLPENADARAQAQRLAERLEEASADEVRGMLVWSKIYREHLEGLIPPAATTEAAKALASAHAEGNGATLPRRNGVNGGGYSAQSSAS